MIESVGLGKRAVWGSAMGSCTAGELMAGLDAALVDLVVVESHVFEADVELHGWRRAHIECTGVVAGYLRTSVGVAKLLE